MANQLISQSQQQRMAQVLAPQLRQSLHLLQLPILELQTVVMEELQTNPTLEERLLPPEPVSGPEDDKPLKPGEEIEDARFEEEFQMLAHLDDEWRDYFQMDNFNIPYTPDDESRREHFFNSLTQGESLQEHLLRQLALLDLGPERNRIGEMLVGNIGDDGYFTADIGELASSTGVEPAEIGELLGMIQEFNPLGVGARDLRECLSIQLDRMGLGDSPAYEIVNRHLDLMAARKYPDIARALKLQIQDVQDAADLIATLEPRPGRAFSGELAAYVLAEVTVEKVNGEYVVTVNNDQIPRLRISRHYRQLMEDPNTTQETKRYIREKIQSSQFLIKSIHQRQQTILRIAQEIVRVQRGFLDHGVSHLAPLTMAAIAGKLGIHETTVSRAVSGKFMQTPRGVFDMKSFFTHGMKTADGADISNQTIKDVIERIIAEEDTEHPLSDQTILEVLAEKGIKVARRTIAKYRDQLGIPPSHLRKSY